MNFVLKSRQLKRLLPSANVQFFNIAKSCKKKKIFKTNKDNVNVKIKSFIGVLFILILFHEVYKEKASVMIH